MVAVIVIVLVVFSLPGYMYIRARQAVSVDVRALNLDEIVEIGTKTSESALRRVRGRARVVAIPDLPGSLMWQARNGHVYVSYAVFALQDGSGYRVGASARPRSLVSLFSIRDMERAMASGRPHGLAEHIGGQFGTWMGQKLWLWSDARKVLFRRWRTFSALRRAEARRLALMAPPPAPPVPELPSEPYAS